MRVVPPHEHGCCNDDRVTRIKHRTLDSKTAWSSPTFPSQGRFKCVNQRPPGLFAFVSQARASARSPGPRRRTSARARPEADQNNWSDDCGGCCRTPLARRPAAARRAAAASQRAPRLRCSQRVERDARQVVAIVNRRTPHPPQNRRKSRFIVDLVDHALYSSNFGEVAPSPRSSLLLSSQIDLRRPFPLQRRGRALPTISTRRRPKSSRPSRRDGDDIAASSRSRDL